MHMYIKRFSIMPKLMNRKLQCLFIEEICPVSSFTRATCNNVADFKQLKAWLYAQRLLNHSQSAYYIALSHLSSDWVFYFY